MVKAMLQKLTRGALYAQVRTVVSNFRLNKQGNVAVITALAALPMIAAVGCVIDYTTASSIKTKLQAAADAASLATVSVNSTAVTTAQGMSSNGTVMFSGQYNDTGSIPIFTSPTQNWVAAVAVPAGGRLLAFTISGSTPSASSTTWTVPGSNQQISLLWPLILGQRSTFRVSNSSDLGSILNQIENDLSEVVTVIGDVLPIIAAIAG